MRDLELIRLVEYVERTRRAFAALFPEAPADPFWNVATYLVRAEVGGEATSQSTLADVAGVPHSTAVRHIEAWIGKGLIERRPRGPKSHSLHASGEMIARFHAYAGHIKSLVAETMGVRWSGEEADEYYFGAGAGQLPPPLHLVTTLADVGHLRFLAHDSSFFVALQNLWADFRNRLGSRRDFDLLSLPDLHARALENARRPSSEYDIIVLNTPWLGEFAAAGLIRSAEAHVFSSGIDALDFDPRVWATGRWQGRQYAVPLFSSIEILAVRGDWLDADGMPPPRTFADVLRIGRRYHAPAKDRYGIVWNAQAGMPIASSFAFVLGCCGSSVLDLPRSGDLWSLQAIDLGDIRVQVDTPAGREALSYLHALVDVSPPGVLDLDWDRALDIFMQGRAAMAYCWSMRAARLEMDVKSKVRNRVRYLPQPAGTRGANVSPLGGFLLAVPSNLPDDRVDAAFAAIRWMTSSDAIRDQRATGFPVLPRFSVSADPGRASASSLVGFVNDLARRNLLATWQRPPLPFYSKIERVLGSAVHAALRGAIGDDEALRSAQGRIEDIVRQGSRPSGRQRGEDVDP